MSEIIVSSVEVKIKMKKIKERKSEIILRMIKIV